MLQDKVVKEQQPTNTATTSTGGIGHLQPEASLPQHQDRHLTELDKAREARRRNFFEKKRFMNNNNPYGSGESANKHDDMPDIDSAAATAVVKTVTADQSNAANH